VDLGILISGGEVIASGWSNMRVGGCCTPSTGAVGVKDPGGQRTDGIGKPNGGSTTSLPGITRGAVDDA